MVQVMHEVVEVVVDVREEERKELSEKTEGCDDEYNPIHHHQAILVAQHSVSFYKHSSVCIVVCKVNTPLLWPRTVLLSPLQSTSRFPSLLHCCRQTLLLH